MPTCIRTPNVSGPCRTCGFRDEPVHILTGDKPGEYWFYCAVHCPSPACIARREGKELAK